MDSRDIAPPAEGDVLLVFADPDDAFAEYAFEWVRLAEDENLVPSDVPEAYRNVSTERPSKNPNAKKVRQIVPPLVVVHGVIHRTWDLARRDDRFASIRAGFRVGCIEGTKIGGFPTDVQEPAGSSGVFVAAMASVQPCGEKAFPWVNEEAPLQLREVHKLNTWKLGDMGTLNVYRDADGTVVGGGDGY